MRWRWPNAEILLLLPLQEGLGIDASLFEDGAQRAFGHVARVVGDGGVAVQRGVEPNFVATSSLAVELQAQRFQSFDDVSITKTRQRAHQMATING